MRTHVVLRATVVALMHMFSARSTAQLIRICENAGRRYTNEGCDAARATNTRPLSARRQRNSSTIRLDVLTRTASLIQHLGR
jgi:hypothetical protein